MVEKSIQLPDGGIQYPIELCRERERITRALLVLKETGKPNIRARLKLISDAFLLFHKQTLFESELKTRALGVMMRDRALAKKRLLHG